MCPVGGKSVKYLKFVNIYCIYTNHLNLCCTQATLPDKRLILKSYFILQNKKQNTLY